MYNSNQGQCFKTPKTRQVRLSPAITTAERYINVVHKMYRLFRLKNNNQHHRRVHDGHHSATTTNSNPLHQMDPPDHCKKRKRKYNMKFSPRLLAIFLSFLVFVLFISIDWSPEKTRLFEPVLIPNLSLIPSHLLHISLATEIVHPSPLKEEVTLPVKVEHRVKFPDHLVLILSNKLHSSENLECVYYNNAWDSISKPALSVDVYHEDKSIVRCQLPGVDYSTFVDLRWTEEVGKNQLSSLQGNDTMEDKVIPSWDGVVYEAILDWNTAVVFVKELNIQQRVESDPSLFKCHFASDQGFQFTTEATAVAQEVVRCLLPRSIRKTNVEMAEGMQVTISRANDDVKDAIGSDFDDDPFPSIAKVYKIKPYKGKEKYELCACTMLWNKASFLREWIMYHAWSGVQRWFIYDNNSDDEIQEVINELNSENYNISRHAWPWIKAQEAGFSHCSLRARNECKWVGFFDVDEFFYFPSNTGKDTGHNSLRDLVGNHTYSPTYAEIRTIMHSFGPSGLTSIPLQGVTVGYTCRRRPPDGYRYLVRPDLLDITLTNAVNHFKLREGYKVLSIPETTVVVNHYKYQVWDAFKAKFHRRASTYVPDWQDEKSRGSRDKAPGLGTEAIEPRDWNQRFCDVWDTGLKDIILPKFADPATGFLPWQRSIL